MKTLNSSELKNQVAEIYKERGLKGVYSFLKQSGISFNKNVVEFGLRTNKTACAEKTEWVNSSELRFHYYSIGIKARSGYSYNKIRGIEIILL